jgi:hypothetical protein
MACPQVTGFVKGEKFIRPMGNEIRLQRFGTFMYSLVVIFERSLVFHIEVTLHTGIKYLSNRWSDFEVLLDFFAQNQIS